jgi:hypothetical protein
MVAKLSLVECMAAVEDPRVDRTKAHGLQAILVLSVLAVLCGADRLGGHRVVCQDPVFVAQDAGTQRGKQPMVSVCYMYQRRSLRSLTFSIKTIW